MANKLHTVADAKNGYTHLKDLGVTGWSAFLIDAAGPAGEDNSYRSNFRYVNSANGVRHDDGINSAFVDAAGDKLLVLPAKINNKNCFPCQNDTSVFVSFYYRFCNFTPLDTAIHCVFSIYL